MSVSKRTCAIHVRVYSRLSVSNRTCAIHVRVYSRLSVSKRTCAIHVRVYSRLSVSTIFWGNNSIDDNIFSAINCVIQGCRSFRAVGPSGLGYSLFTVLLAYLSGGR